jgi:RadC-like JAB domain
MTGRSVSAVSACTAHPDLASRPVAPRRHRVRELVCAYRPVRDEEGRIISVVSLALNSPQAAAQLIAPLMADQPVEMFAVACLSARNRLLAWHIVSRGTRSRTLVSIPDVFVPACVTPGTVIATLLGELNVDDTFTELVGRPQELPTRRYPEAIAVALALRHSWRRDDLVKFAKRFGVKLTTRDLNDNASTGAAQPPSPDADATGVSEASAN